MRRLFVPKEQICDEHVLIEGSDAHYLTNVLRLEKGNEILAFDGEGSLYTVEITKTAKGSVEGLVKDVSTSTKDTKIDITLVQGVAKGEKMDYIVQKCTEIGISKIIPILTERTVVKLDEKKKKNRQERWQKIAKEAAKQSRRVMVPEIGEVTTLDRFKDTLTTGERTIILWEDELNLGLKTYLQKQDKLEKLNIIIGPEGGFSEAEVNKLKEKGVMSISLGSRILRTETAGLATATMVLYELGDLG